MSKHALLGIAGYTDPDGDFGPWVGAGEELLGALYDTAEAAGPTGAAAAGRHSVTAVNGLRERRVPLSGW